MLNPTMTVSLYISNADADVSTNYETMETDISTHLGQSIHLDGVNADGNEGMVLAADGTHLGDYFYPMTPALDAYLDARGF